MVLTQIDSDSLKATTIDITSTCSDKFNKATHTMSYVDQSRIFVRHSLINNKSASEVRWAMLTYDDIEFVDATTAIVRKDSQSLRFKILKPQGDVMKQYSAAPTLHYEEKIEDLVMIGFEYELSPNQFEYRDRNFGTLTLFN